MSPPPSRGSKFGFDLLLLFSFSLYLFWDELCRSLPHKFFEGRLRRSLNYLLFLGLLLLLDWWRNVWSTWASSILEGRSRLLLLLRARPSEIRVIPPSGIVSIAGEVIIVMLWLISLGLEWAWTLMILGFGVWQKERWGLGCCLGRDGGALGFGVVVQAAVEERWGLGFFVKDLSSFMWPS